MIPKILTGTPPLLERRNEWIKWKKSLNCFNRDITQLRQTDDFFQTPLWVSWTILKNVPILHSLLDRKKVITSMWWFWWVMVRAGAGTAAHTKKKLEENRSPITDVNVQEEQKSSNCRVQDTFYHSVRLQGKKLEFKIKKNIQRKKFGGQMALHAPLSSL